MKLFIESGLNRLKWDLRDIDDDTLHWRVVPEANSVKWLLTHISAVLNVYFPRAITADFDYAPINWIEEYSESNELPYETIMRDIEKGKNETFKGLTQLPEGSLDTKLDWYIGEYTRETYLMILSSEILHHEGQIASIIGLKKRLDGEPPRIVPPEI